MTYQQMTKLSEIVAPVYAPLFNDTKHTDQCLTSGRAGTKSSFMGIKAVNQIVSNECAVIIMRKRHNKLRKTVYKECMRAIRRQGLDPSKHFKCTVSPMQITYLENGSTIYFTGNDNVDDTKGIIDDKYPIKLVVIDELTEFFEQGDGDDELQNIKATFVRGNDDYFTTMYLFNPPKNPKAPVMQWLDDMKVRPNFIHIHADYRDIPVEWLGKILVQEADLLKEYDEKMYRWLWLGECIGLDDVIYYMFNEERHIKDITDYSKLKMIGIGVDYGQMNATTFEAFGIDPKNKAIRGIDEYYHSGRDSGKQRSPSVYAQDMKEFIKSVEKETDSKVSFIVIDPSAKGLSEEIRRVCPGYKIINANNKVSLGIGRVQKLLTYNWLLLSSKQKNAIDEFQIYEWDKKSIESGEEKPSKVNDHTMDAIRYYIMAVWQYIFRLLPFKETEEE